MMKKIVIATLVALMVSFVSPAYNANAQSCSDVTGGNVTFTVCSGNSVDHYWSSTKIKVNWFNQSGASLTISNENGNFSQTDYFHIGDSKTYYVEDRPVDHAYSKTIWVKVKYAGNDSNNTSKALIQVDSNTTYEDSKYVKSSNTLLTAPVVSVSDSYKTNGTKYVDISWNVVTGAADYFVDIEVKDAYGNYGAYNYSLGTSGHTSYTEQVNTGSYRVRIQAYKIDEYSWNNSNPWSEWKYFTVAEESNLVAPTIYGSDPYYVDGKRYVDIGWDKLDDAAAYYAALEYKSEASYDYGLEAFSTYITEGKVTFETEFDGYYKVWVRGAKSGESTHDNSNEWGYYYFELNKPEVVLTAPTVTVSDIKYTMTRQRYVDVTWDKLNDADYYILESEKKDAYGTYQYHSENYGIYGWSGNTNTIFDTISISDDNAASYRVRVRGYKSTEDVYSNNNVWSDWVYFTVDAKSALNAPVSLSVSSPYPAAYDPSINLVDFDWADVVDANKYYIYVEMEQNGVYSYIYDKLMYAYEGSYLNGYPIYNPNNYYRFTIVAIDADEDYGDYSDWYYFTDTTGDTQYNNNLNTPQITSPSPYGETTYYVNSADIIWDSVSGAGGYEFEVEFLNNGYWTGYYYLKTSDNYNYNTYLSAYGDYRTRVRAHGDVGMSSWSDYIYFKYAEYENNNNYLAQPTITFPANNQMIYHNSDHYFDYGDNLTERTLDTTWNPVSGADYYKIMYEVKDSYGNWGYYTDFNVYNNTDFLYNWLDVGGYRVKVKAIDNSNNESNWSDWTYFEIYDFEGMSMSDSSGGDGLYTVLKGNSITHTPTGIKATVENVDHAVAYLRLENADKDLIYIKKYQSYWAENSNGVKVFFYFADIDKDGLDIKVYTEGPQYPATQTVSSTVNSAYYRDAKRISDLKQIQTALELYYTDNGDYPLSHGAAVLGDNTHECLNSNGWASAGCSNPYMGNVPSDPGNNNYIYIQWENTYVIISTFEGTIDYLSGNVYTTPSGISNYFN